MSGSVTKKSRESSRFDPEVPDPQAAKVRTWLRSCREWYGQQRSRFVEDLKFANGDSDNQYQWDADVLEGRKDKPCLTMNIVRQHNKQIINSAKAARSGMRVIPVGAGATKASADCMNLLLQRQILSSANLVYDMARKFQVEAGLGYWRIISKYLPGDTFDQELFLKEIANPLMVWLDSSAVLDHGGDANYGIVEDKMRADISRGKYPRWRDYIDDPSVRMMLDEQEHEEDGEPLVQVCELFERTPEFFELLSFIDKSTGRRMSVREDMVPSEVKKAIKAEKTTKVREIEDWRVDWHLLVGDRTVDSTKWEGRHIPIIRLVGEMTLIEEELDIKGHTRALKDAQRMFNYNASSQVQHVGLQTKVPWYGPAEAIAEFEAIWKSSNIEDHVFLPYKHLDKDGNPIPAPQKLPPPASSQAFEAGMSTAFNQMMMVSGQWQNQMGMMGNERTGSAIQERQEQGDVATYHFKSNFDDAQAWTAQQLIELYPKYYDTARLLQMVKENGEELQIQIDPSNQKIYELREAEDAAGAMMVLNPSMGRYEVRPAVGEAYASRREKTVQTMTMLLTQAPGLTAIIGDLLLDAMDFKEASEAAARMRRMVPPQAMGVGPSQAEAQLRQQVQMLQGNLAKSLQNAAKLQLKYDGRSQMRDIDAYKAETDRIKALGEQLGLDPQVVVQIIDALGKDISKTSLTPIIEANQDELAADTTKPTGEGAAAGDPFEGQPPHPAAQQAPDGEWYLSDPTRRGRYLKIAPLAQQHAPPDGGGS